MNKTPPIAVVQALDCYDPADYVLVHKKLVGQFLGFPVVEDSTVAPGTVELRTGPTEPRANVPDWIWGAISQLSCGNWEINCTCSRCNERREAQLWLDARFPHLGEGGQ